MERQARAGHDLGGGLRLEWPPAHGFVVSLTPVKGPIHETPDWDPRKQRFKSGVSQSERTGKQWRGNREHRGCVSRRVGSARCGICPYLRPSGYALREKGRPAIATPSLPQTVPTPANRHRFVALVGLWWLRLDPFRRLSESLLGRRAPRARSVPCCLWRSRRPLGQAFVRAACRA